MGQRQGRGGGGWERCPPQGGWGEVGRCVGRGWVRAGAADRPGVSAALGRGRASVHHPCTVHTVGGPPSGRRHGGTHHPAAGGRAAMKKVDSPPAPVRERPTGSGQPAGGGRCGWRPPRWHSCCCTDSGGGGQGSTKENSGGKGGGREGVGTSTRLWHEDKGREGSGGARGRTACLRRYFMRGARGGGGGHVPTWCAGWGERRASTPPTRGCGWS